MEFISILTLLITSSIQNVSTNPKQIQSKLNPKYFKIRKIYFCELPPMNALFATFQQRVNSVK